ncbi:MAG TPA: hypothetical protein VGO62_02300, partial [Myxococcota bacterium]
MRLCAHLALIVITLLVLAAGRAPAAEARTLDVNAFTWTVNESRIVLGDTKQATLTLVANNSDGSALDTAPPRLTTSTGTLDLPVHIAAGTWTVRFVPPSESFPHVAIVVASIDQHSDGKDRTAVGFIPLRLWGKGQTTVKTKPKSVVTVFIGNDAFGPVSATDAGEAKVPIVVPPGPERAVAKSVDDVGNESQKTIDLGVPTFNRVAMVALDPVATADGSGQARLLVFAVDKKGEPLYQAKLTSKASAGDVDKEPVGLSPGMFLLAYRPGKAPKGTARVDVALEGAPESKGFASIDLLSGPPARATVDGASVLSADEPRALSLQVRLFDQAGNAVPAKAASVDVDYGRIDQVSDGKVTWIIPAELSAGHDKATLTVRGPDGVVLGNKAVALLAGKPAKLSFDPVDSVIADGESSVEVHLRVVDRVGNALVPTGAVIRVDDRWGQLVGATTDGKLYRARFVPAATDHADFAPLTGALGALTAEESVKIVPRPRARLLVGLGAVADSNYGSLLQVGPDLSLLVRLPGFDSSVHAGLSVSLLQSVSSNARAFPLFVEGAWRPLLAEDIALHLGAAAGFVLSDEVTATSRI